MVVDQRADHEPRAVLRHRVERRAVALDVVEHAFDDLGRCSASTCAMRRDENAGISSRRSRACCSPSIWVMNSMPMNLSYCS